MLGLSTDMLYKTCYVSTLIVSVVKPWYQIFTMLLNDYYFIAWYLQSALRYFNEYNGTTVGLLNRDIIRGPL